MTRQKVSLSSSTLAPQDIVEAHDDGKGEAPGLDLLDHLGHIDEGRSLFALRVDTQMPLGVDLKVALAPLANLVEAV